MSDLDEALRRLAAVPRLLVALDFDGVLAPIVAVPSEARPLPESAGAVVGLSAAPGTTVALVSGRGLASLTAVSGFEAPVRMVGSHGAEFDAAFGAPSVLDDEQQARLDRLVEGLQKVVDGVPGVTLETKPTGVAVHIRNATPADGARVFDAVRAGPAARPGIETTPGKAVLDLAVLRVNKGLAVEVLRERLGADAVFYAGDDVTDEAVFRVLGPGDVGVKVGAGDTAATHRVADPAELAGVLQSLLAARATP